MNQKVRKQPKDKLLAYLTKHENKLKTIFKENEKIRRN